MVHASSARGLLSNPLGEGGGVHEFAPHVILSLVVTPLVICDVFFLNS